MSVFQVKPERFMHQLALKIDSKPAECVCCAGFELQKWRCEPFASHLIEWLPDYALVEDELAVDHGNMYVRLKQAAVRVYTSEKYQRRGEAGEIALHAICRDFFGTIPISPRVFYKSTSNDVIKSFDMVHARLPENEPVELWLGESKLYTDSKDAISEAISSVRKHIEQGFLQNQKLLIGPQIPKSTPRRDEIMHLFKPQVSLDTFIESTTFVIGILANSEAAKASTSHADPYADLIAEELQVLISAVSKAGISSQLNVLVVYVPLATKAALVSQFDKKLKGLT